MNDKEFKELYTKMRKNEQSLLDFKRGEYTQGDDDILINFKQVSGLTEQSPMQVCATYMMKHIQSIVLAVNRNENLRFDWETPEGKEGLAQRFSDARNYLALLAGLIKDQEESVKHSFDGPEYANSDGSQLADEHKVIYAYIGERPRINSLVCASARGTVRAFDANEHNKLAAIGYRTKSAPFIIGVNEIMVKLFKDKTDEIFEC